VRPLVLLHGMLGGGGSFDGLRTRIEHGPVYAPTLFGHGLSPTPVPRDFDEAADVLAAQIDEQLGVEPIALVGYSFGARLALAFAARHPARVHRALLLSLHPGLAEEPQRLARRHEDASWADLVERSGMNALVDAWEARPVFATQRALPASARDAQRATRLAHQPRAIADAFRQLGLGAMPDLRHALSAVRTELVVGAEDDKFLALACRLRAPVHVLASCGHNPILESPDEIAALVRVLVRPPKEQAS
jgi:2-succinyl-6-hydroxy-2,4-cyclohexadiene-1-carboxylate synthase